MKRTATPKIVLLIIGILIISCLTGFGQVDNNYMDNWRKAFEAKSVAECQSSLKFCNEALKDVPDHPVLNYLAARLNAQLGNSELALEQLKKATELGYNSKMLFHEKHQLNDSAFIGLRQKQEFKEIIKLLVVTEKPIHKSQIAFTVKDKKLNPEGITYDPIEKMFYLGSLDKNKIVKVDQSGKSVDFTNENQDGLGKVMGIHVDPSRRHLWAVSGGEKMKEIFKYNISSGKLIKKYTVPPALKKAKHFFNDLVIHSNGDVFITGSYTIFKIPHSSDKLELFITDNSFVAFNGITLSEDEETIYVSDYLIGIYKIDITTKSFLMLTHEPNIKPHGVDGLYFLNNQLYAVQDVLNTIDRFSLNTEGNHIESCEIYERNTPYLNMPTTGVLVDDYFYFIADTQAKTFDQTGVVIMKASLK
ncbi:SMP-30/gluconolactonase/LRE family protein [Lentimicrobium sp. S6]|uniref:SMP-30/gluconolactonase/LRE family protein n=1 Tax=Lentimicrobium sp. S6 TaxID=2735872 RepID=UPI001555CF64|nr:SMP-30/gluconolactonase/LRE family protein [Lentimicrobium sp. S6]NPD47280.1 hypothetical protein [Lentimicrobium sp. S6]